MSTNTKKENKNTKKETGKIVWSAIIGIAKMFGVMSISYSSVVIIQGTDGLFPKIAILPQLIIAVGYLIDHFVIKRSK